jgi:hypothetical protein
MKRAEDDRVKAIFLRSPDNSSLCNSDASNWLIPVRFIHQDGTPVKPDDVPRYGFLMYDNVNPDATLQGSLVVDDTGIVIFPYRCPRESHEVTLRVTPNGGFGYDCGEATYRRYHDHWTDPMQTIVVSPAPDTILPRDTPIIVTAYNALHNGSNPWPDQSHPALPPLLWECSAPQVVLKPLPDLNDSWHFRSALLRRAELTIPADASIDGDSLCVTVRPEDPHVPLEPATVCWRVASARQLYITPALDAVLQPVSCELFVTATLFDESNQPVPMQAVQWSWQCGLLSPPEPLGDGTTDANGQARAKLKIPDGGTFSDTLVASSGMQSAMCTIVFSAKAGARPSICVILEPAPGSVLSVGQLHSVHGAYRFAARGMAKGKKVSWSTDPRIDAVVFTPDMSDGPTESFCSVNANLEAGEDAEGLTVALVGVSPNPLSPDGMDVMRVEGIRFCAATDSELLIEYPGTGGSLSLGRPLVAKAVFVDKTGAPIRQVDVTWQWENAVPLADLPTVEPGTKQTDANGISQVTIQANTLVTADLRATATDPSTGLVYEAVSQRVAFYIGQSQD